MVGLEEHWRFNMPYVIYKSATEKPSDWPNHIGYEGPVKVKVESFVTENSAKSKKETLAAAEPNKQFVIIQE